MYTEVWMLMILVILLVLFLAARFFAKRVPQKTNKARALEKSADHKILFLVDNRHRYRFEVDEQSYHSIPLEVNGQLTYQGERFLRFKGDEFDVVGKEPTH